MIRKDVKIIQKQEDKELGISEDSDDQNEWEEKINHKVQYGTDTDSELEEAYWMEVDKRKALQLQQEEEYESEEDYEEEEKSSQQEESKTITEQDSLNESQDDMISSSSSRAGAGTSIEMVDLRQKRVKKPQGEFVMREFQPAGKVNQSQKKREKRKK